MLVTAQALIYGGKPLHIIQGNFGRAGYSFFVNYVNIHGLDRAYNTGLDHCIRYNYDAVVFLSNDITEPEGWLRKRIDLMERDREIGICSIPINETREHPGNEDLIGNLMIKREVIEAIGAFNPVFHPYGPLDLDYCIRARKAGFKTSYVTGERAEHPHPHGGGDPEKQELVNRFWPIHERDAAAYRNGQKDIYIPLKP